MALLQIIPLLREEQIMLIASNLAEELSLQILQNNSSMGINKMYWGNILTNLNCKHYCLKHDCNHAGMTGQELKHRSKQQQVRPPCFLSYGKQVIFGPSLWSSTLLTRASSSEYSFHIQP